MEVVLRQGASLARACTDAIADICIDPSFSLSVNQISEATVAVEFLSEIQERLAHESALVRAKMHAIRELMDARGAIRLAIKQANQREISGFPSVETLLNHKATLDAKLQHLTSLHGRLIQATDMYGRVHGGGINHDAQEVAATLRNIRHRLETVTSGSVSDFISVAVLPKAEIDGIADGIAALKRRLSMLNDELAAANLRSTIDLSDVVVAVLRRHKIIDPVS